MIDVEAFAAAHVLAIAALEDAHAPTAPETIRVHGPELLRLARLCQSWHEKQGRGPEPSTDRKNRTGALIRDDRTNHA